jgi:3-keto-5-aminohexanoate cleavage enzyme
MSHSFSVVLGVLGLQATVDNLVFLKNSIPEDATVTYSGHTDIYTLGPVAIALGGHVRTGLEDGVHIEKALARMTPDGGKMARISEMK